MEVLRWAREHGCIWDEQTCASAAEDGHLEVLKWARERGCPWDWVTCFHAAHYGHLELLRWAWEHGLPWAEITCEAAAENGNLGGAEVCAGAPLPMGRKDLCFRRCGRTPGDVAVGAGEWLPLARKPRGP
jgi:hypothetical protein